MNYNHLLLGIQMAQALVIVKLVIQLHNWHHPTYLPTYCNVHTTYVHPLHRAYSACSSKPKRAKPVWIAGDSEYTSSQPVLWLLARSVTKNGKQGRLSGFEVIYLLPTTSNTYISTVSLLVNR